MAEPLGAQIALTNPDGIRADLAHADDGVVTFGESYAVQPFGNRLQRLELSGAQLVAILEQQFQTDVFGGSFERILAPSHTLHYAIDRAAPPGRRIQDVTVAGQPLDPAAMYVVIANDFLADGGDGFTAFTEARRTAGAGADLEALNTTCRHEAGLTAPPGRSHQRALSPSARASVGHADRRSSCQYRHEWVPPTAGIRPSRECAARAAGGRR